ncbi:MAG: glycosyltransferase family 4 protein [Planctomycetota bacterium]
MNVRANMLAKGLADLGWIAVLVLESPLEPEQEYVQPGVQYVTTGVGIKGMLSRVRALKDLSPSFVHYLNPMLSAFMMEKIARGKWVSIGDWEDWHTNPENPSIHSRTQRLADRWFIRNCGLPIVCSRWLQKEFRSRFGRSDCLYLPYAETLPPAKAVDGGLFAEPTAVFMGALHPHWNHRILIEAARIMKGESGFKPPIIFIGDGKDRQSCIELSRKYGLDNVRFTGRLGDSEMTEHLRSASVLLFPIEDNMLNRSRCPFKVFHYAASKRPIITSPVGEVREFLGNKAIYCDGSPEAFASLVEQSLKTPLPNVEYGIEKHTWTRRAVELDARLEQCL